MTPDRLRRLSLQTFKATVYCAIGGIVLLIGAPNRSFDGAAGPIARVIAIGGFGLLGAAVMTNLVSLITGIVAWAKGGGRCPWIFACALVFLVPLGLWAAVKLSQ